MSADPLGTVRREDHDGGHSIWVLVGRALVRGLDPTPFRDWSWLCIESTDIERLGFRATGQPLNSTVIGSVPGTPAVDGITGSIDWAREVLREAGIDPRTRLIQAVKELRSRSGSAGGPPMSLYRARDLAEALIAEQSIGGPS